MTTPIITSIQPSAGSAGGGTQVAIAGSGLGTATAPDVLFGAMPAASLVSASDSLLTVVTPPAPAFGVVPVSVQTPNGTANWPGGFDYEVTVSSINPTSGPVTGGTVLTIKGSGFLQVAGVQFNDTPVPAVTVATDIEMTVTTPPAAAPGTADLSFMGSAGQTAYVEFAGFTYTAVPTTVQTNPPGSGTGGGSGTPTTTGGQTTTSNGQAPPSQTTSGQAPPTQTSPGKSPGQPPAQTQTGPAPAQTPTQPSPSQTQATQPGQPQTGTPATQPQAPAQTTAAGATTPAPGNYIPGGAMIVPGGQTGLGGTAGTGAGFGTGTLLPGGGGSAAPSDLSYYVDPGLTAQLVQTLVGLVQSAASPDAIEAQNMILRRMALEGDVVGSRIPPPRNISEFGGYLNLLDKLDDPTMREQALAGALGVAGPSVPLGWISNEAVPLSMVAVVNDRPAVPAQRSFPISVLVRSDFVAGVQTALKTLHGFGAFLPLTSPSVILLPPGGTGATIPSPVLFYLGRTLTIAPSAALANPAADPILIISGDGTLAHCSLASQVLGTATFQVEPADVLALQGSPTSTELVPVQSAEFVSIAPILAAAGYYPASPLPIPANTNQTGWASLTNTVGLVSGSTKLGDELALLYRPDQIEASVFASMLTWTWNGSAFAP